MTDPMTQFEHTLKQHQKSITEARRVVFNALLNHEPQSMNELIRRCKNSIDRASIYRTIVLFERLGILQRIQFGWKYKLELSNEFTFHHHHLTCITCHTIIPLPEDEQLEARLQLLATTMHFDAKDHLIEIRGFCNDCSRLHSNL